jgi:hypothetical protein
METRRLSLFQQFGYLNWRYHHHVFVLLNAAGAVFDPLQLFSLALIVSDEGQPAGGLLDFRVKLTAVPVWVPVTL